MKPSYNSMKLPKTHYRWLQNLYFHIYLSWYPLYLSHWVPWGNKEPVFNKLYQQNWLLWSLYEWYCKVSYYFSHFSFIPQRISSLNPHLGPNFDSWHLEYTTTIMCNGVWTPLMVQGHNNVAKVMKIKLSRLPYSHTYHFFFKIH